MRILPVDSAKSRASTLMIALIVTGLVGFTLAAFLSLLGAQNNTTMRSQAWNSSIPVLEAGCEDALSHLNAHGKTNLLCDGWSFTNNQYVMTRWIEDDSFYTVGISNYPSSPVLFSLGYVEVPGLASAGGPLVHADAAGVPAVAKTYLRRGACLTIRRNGLFVKAMVAKSNITMSGSSVLIDSFDSSNPLYSTNGFYTSSKRRDNGDVASDGQLMKEITASGNVKIYGHVSTGPGGTVGTSGNVSIGDQTWVDAGAGGVKTNWFRDDMNIAFPDVQVPFNGGNLPLGPATIGGTNYALVLGNNGNYLASTISLAGTNKIMVTANAVLYLTGNLNMSGSSAIIIAPGASLKLYVAGSKGSLSGQGVMNQTGFATNFVYYGLPGNTQVDLSGGAGFTGLIYAPQARLNVSGGSTIVGATITDTVSATGGFTFHYDESLGSFGDFTPYIVTSWNELTPDELGGSILTMAPPAK